MAHDDVTAERLRFHRELREQYGATLPPDLAEIEKAEKKAATKKAAAKKAAAASEK